LFISLIIIAKKHFINSNSVEYEWLAPMHRNDITLNIVGGGLAGSEAAWQAAERGHKVRLFEMRPTRMTPAHSGGNLGELICSNSLGSRLPDRPSGLLQNELRTLGQRNAPGNIASLLLNCAEQSAVPAGGSLAVDRELFSDLVTNEITKHPNIQLIREEVTRIPDSPSIIATGPLTSDAMAQSIQTLTGFEHLSFFDAISPTVIYDSIDMDIAFRASRYGRGEQDSGDYINCPMNKEQYLHFLHELLSAARILLHEFETRRPFFEGCLPIEELANRGTNSLTYGPLRPVGLTNPHDTSHPYAVVQLRQDNLAGSLYNIVGFQTNLTFFEQKRVLQLIPGLERVEIARFGQMHRNTFIAAPALLNPTLEFRSAPGLFFSGQITGVEGYLGNIATGWLAGVNAGRYIESLPLLQLPQDTMLGALLHYITHAELSTFQPTKATFGILPPLLDPNRSRRERSAQYVRRAQESLRSWLEQ
jgi:methylenetetrahydrofolate--tRNA-(uracil-5-)-methyltransferase